MEEFPEALHQFINSPKANELSVQDSFYLLGVCRIIGLLYWGPPESRMETYHKHMAAMRQTRALAWSKAATTSRALMTAMAVKPTINAAQIEQDQLNNSKRVLDGA